MTGDSMDAASPLPALIGNRPELFRLLVAFNFRPADYLHPTRRACFFAGGMHDAVWNEVRAHAPLSRFILVEMGLEQEACFDLARPEWPAALLDEGRLLRLARHIGAVLLAPNAQRSLARQQVLEWKAKLTPEAYRFALDSASLLSPAGPVPAPAPGLSPEAIGYGWIDASLAQAPHALAARARLKLPAASAAPQAAPRTVRHLVNLIHSALEPAWFSSFAALRR